jgi:hypothetical protein
MTRLYEFLGRVSDPSVLAGLALPLLAGGAIAHWHLDLPVQSLAGSRAMQIFFGALLILLVARLFHSILDRSLPGVLLAGGLLLTVLLAGIETARWFQESVRLGEGEAAVISRVAGRFPGVGGPKEVTYLESGQRSLRIRAGEREMEVERGTWTPMADGLALRVTKVAPAPRFAIQDGEGRELEGYVKLADEPAPDEYIRVGLLPHWRWKPVPGDSR